MIEMTIPSMLGIALFVVGVPSVATILIFRPNLMRLALAIMVFLTCEITKPFYMEVFFQPYRGVDRGFGVTLPDILFFGIAIALLVRRPSCITWLPPGILLWIALSLVSVISISGAGEPLYSWFTIHKFLRCAVLYWAVTNVIQTDDDLLAILKAMICILIWQGLIVFLDKYVTHEVVVRAMGSFNHPNAMAMYLNIILPIVWICVLEGVIPRRWIGPAFIGLSLGFISVLFTKSRGAIVLMPLTILGVTYLSILCKPKIRKLRVLVPAMFVIGIVLMLAAPRIIARFQNAPIQSGETRQYFNAAALAMANDLTLGCGINQYSWTLENTDYYWCVYPDMVDTPDPEAFRNSPQGRRRLGTAHNIYLLFLAETGWIGLSLFVLFLLRIFALNVWLLMRVSDPIDRAVLLGAIGAFMLLHVHGSLEWAFRQTQIIYLFFIVSGMIAAIDRGKRLARARKY